MIRPPTRSTLFPYPTLFRSGLTADFIGRPDGLPGLQRVYGFRPRAVRALLPAVKYQALAAGEVDVIDGYSTDGFVARDRKSTRLNSSHANISYAVFCLNKTE